MAQLSAKEQPVPLFSRVLENAGAPPLVILHGLLGSSDNWQTLGKRYQEAFEVHLLDARNHGRSPHTAHHNYGAMANDVLRYLDDRAMSKVRIMGHSMGGKTVLQLLHQAPERLERIAVADMAARAYAPHHQPIFDALNALDLQTISTREQAQDHLTAALADPGVVAFLMKGLHRKKEGGFEWRANLPVLEGHLDQILQSIPLEINTIPTLVVYGTQSPYVSDSDLAAYDQACLQLEVAPMPGVGHWLHAEAPDAFFDITWNFFQG
jgi:pimeloyl-ACP methyl ester carboxylesterase